MRLGAVEALDAEGRHIAYAFNDLVIGNTFLGTAADGSMKTYAARALAERGETVEEVPVKDLFRGAPSVSLDGKSLELPFTAAQLAACPIAPDNFYGRTYTGILCYTKDSSFMAAA